MLPSRVSPSIEAGNAEEEALAIAIALREAMETPDKTAALVTPDRALARRVLAALARWNVPVDDSGGDALSDTPSGVFARLVAEAALEGLPPVTLLALLKHEKCRLDRRAVAVLERAVLRGPRPKPGSAGLAHALATFREELAKLRRNEAVVAASFRSARRRSRMRSLTAAGALIERLKAALAPLEALPNKPATFAAIANVPRAGAAKPGRHRRRAGRGVRRHRERRVDRDRARRLSRAVPCRHRRDRRAPTGAERARAHLRSARSAPAIGRPAGAGRPGRRRLAAGDARRPVAQPADAP